jgi:uncharacterized protein (DUF2147 family)
MIMLPKVVMPVLLTVASAAQAGDLDGQWARGDGVARVKIASCGANVCVTNTWIKPGISNEKAGDMLVMTIKPVAGGEYSGSAFDPQRDLHYRIDLTVNGNSMTTKGCMLGGLLCKNVGWNRIN